MKVLTNVIIGIPIAFVGIAVSDSYWSGWLFCVLYFASTFIKDACIELIKNK